MKQNNSTEFLSYSFHNIYNRDGSQTPMDPKSDFLQSFKISKIQSFKMFWYMLIQYYQKIISCFWQIFIPYSSFSKDMLDGSSTFFGPHRFQILQRFGCHKFWDLRNYFSNMIRDSSWIIWSVLVSQKINNIGFGSHGHV